MSASADFDLSVRAVKEAILREVGGWRGRSAALVTRLEVVNFERELCALIAKEAGRAAAKEVEQQFAVAKVLEA